MGEFFESIYCSLFENFFGVDLGDFLSGVANLDYQTNLFFWIGLAMLLSSILFVVLYYYIINHPRLNRLWGWLIFLGAAAFINFIVGWQWTLHHLLNNHMYRIDPSTGAKIALNVKGTNCLAFGLSDFIISALTFVIFTFILRWWSRNCSRTPFL